jgi:hypothetical protein
MNVDFSQGYAPAQGERGKFVVIDSSTITDLPSSSQGRYAVLTYNIGNATTSPGASSSNPIYISTVKPNTLYMVSDTYYNVANVFTPSVALETLEIYNNTNNSTVYFMASNVSSTTLSAKGIPINSYSYYSLTIPSISQFTICATPSADVRIMGFYKG